MRPTLRGPVLAATIALLALSITPSIAATPKATAPAVISVNVDPNTPVTAAVPTDFLGLSIEKSALESQITDASKGNLVSLLRQLGTPVLRFGGNTADRVEYTASGTSLGSDWSTPPSEGYIGPADYQRLAGLARAAGAEVIIGVPLGNHDDPSDAGVEALAAHNALGSALIGIEVGNEPNAYCAGSAPCPTSGSTGTYSPGQYQTDFDSYVTAIHNQVPGLAVVGSAAYAATGGFLNDFNLDGQSNSFLTQHIYPQTAVACGGSPSIATMLSRNAAKNEAGQTNTGLTAASANNATPSPLRIDETNNVICSGQDGVSNVFASALWAADYESQAMSLGVGGVNLHSGRMNACSGATFAFYAPLCPSDLSSNTFTPQPEWAAFQLLQPFEGSRFISTLSSNTSQNVSVHAAVDPSGVVRVLVDEMDASGSAPAVLNLTLPASYKTGTTTNLSSPNLADKSVGVVDASGVVGGNNGTFTVSVPAGSASLFTLSGASVTPTVSVAVAPASGSTAGTPAAVTTTVTAVGSVPVATGTVNVTSRGGLLSGCVGIPLVAVTPATVPATATATCSTRALGLGSHDVTGVYSGDALHYNPASGSLSGFTVKTQDSAFAKTSLEMGDTTATMSFSLAAQRSGAVNMSLTAAAKGHATRVARNRSGSGQLKVTGLTDSVKYTFTLTVQRVDGFSASKVISGIPRHLPKLTMSRSSTGLNGTLTISGHPVVGQVIVLYTTVGTRQIIVGKTRTSFAGFYAFTFHPKVRSTYTAWNTQSFFGLKYVTRSRPVPIKAA